MTEASTATNNTVRTMYPAKLLADLAASGLGPEDVRAKPISAAEKAATGAPMGADGYVLPYFSSDGRPLPFYRVKLYDSAIKYRQLADSPNHVYYPPRLGSILGSAKYILITEGEKKAAAAVKMGYPCVALGGVDNWRSRTLNLPKETTIAQKPDGRVSFRLPAGGQVTEGADTIALGLKELIDLATSKAIPIIICFDSDAGGTWKPEVARAAASLGFELRFRGVPMQSIRALVLPDLGEGKTGLDDFLLQEDGPDRLERLILQCLAKRSSFPRYPNVREYVNKKLQRTQMPRQDQMSLAMAILSDLDARGQRLRSPDEGALYYFSDEDKSLIKVEFSGKPEFAETPFGRKLYKEYNLGWSDARVLGWLMTLFSGEEPISEVHPEKVLAWREDTLYYHLNAGTMVKISSRGVWVLDNGTDNVLFESGLIEDIDAEEFNTALVGAIHAKNQNWWYDVLKQCKIQEAPDDRHRKLLSLLYYVSPFFYRWRGTQLPVEITTGEPGSGKSTLYELRLTILTGVPKLRNAPTDLRDWTASLASTGAMHVTDNVQLTNSDLRQKLSDEICRLVTEPKPSIEQRKLYTNTGVVKVPVRVVFGITAVKQPFSNVDIIQRAIITNLDKGTEADLRYDAEWKEHQLEHKGGRVEWLAHQLVMVGRMLKAIDTEWQPRYQARYRLINVEQLLMMAAKALLWDPKWIPQYLESNRDARVGEADWTLEGLKAFSEAVKEKYPEKWHLFRFDAAAVVSWIAGNEEYEKCTVLQSSRNLGRYLSTNKHTVATTAGIVPDKIISNKQQFMLRDMEAK